MSNRTASQVVSVARLISRLPNAVGYDRRVQIPPVVEIWPSDLLDTSFEGRLRVVRIIRRALRAERQRARVGAPSYRLERHAALLRIARLEEADLLRELRRELRLLSESRRRVA